MKTFRMILIDPELETITEHQVSHKHDAMRAMIGNPDTCDTFRIADHPKTRDYGLVDDGGLSRGDPVHAFQLIGFPDPVAGKCLVFGAEKGGGATCSAAFDLGTLTNVVRFLGLIVPHVFWVREGNVDRAKVTWSKA